MRERERERVRERERERVRERERESERERLRGRGKGERREAETDRERERQMERDREREGQRDRERAKVRERVNQLTYLKPLVNDVLHEKQLLLPFLHLNLKRFNKRGSPHCLGLHNVVIQQGLDVVQRTQNAHTLDTNKGNPGRELNIDRN